MPSDRHDLASLPEDFDITKHAPQGLPPAPAHVAATAAARRDEALASLATTAERVLNAWAIWKGLMPLVGDRGVAYETAVRVDARAVCPDCRLPFYRHPEIEGWPSFHRGCDGALLKL